MSIALLLHRPSEARTLGMHALGLLCDPSHESLESTTLALWTALSIGRAARAEGHLDEALEIFERLAALTLGGSFELGPLAISPELASRLQREDKTLFLRLSAGALAEAMETLIARREHTIALSIARMRLPSAPYWFDTFRYEAIATSLGALSMADEALVFLSSAIAREPEQTRLVLEQKRAEMLQLSGQTDAARGRSLAVAEALIARWDGGAATLDDLVIAARASRLLSRLGHEASSKLAARARPFARLLGDIPLEAELSLRVVENEGEREAHASALLSLSRITLESGHPLLVLPDVPICRCPGFVSLSERLMRFAV